jgi:hypothetical protein
MGRYYSGDIEGKFWFAVQSSDDAGFFGGEHYEPNYVNYEFYKDDLPSIKAGIKQCNKALGVYKKQLDEFFSKRNSYNDKEIEDELKLTVDEVREKLQWYARLMLGERILKCVEKTGQCCFEAEY